MRASLGWAAGAVCLCLACGNTGPRQPGDMGSADLAAPQVMTVEVRATDGLSFDPPNITVPRGGAVRWVNRGAAAHTATSGKSSQAADYPGLTFDQVLSSGQSFVVTFPEAGTQPYFCRYHELMGMTGTVTVTP